MRTRVLLFVILALIAAGCSSELTSAEPVAATPPAAVDEAEVAPASSTVPRTNSEAPSPERLPFAERNPLCTDIDVAIDAALVGDQQQLAAIADSNRLVGRHLPEDLQGPNGSALPLGNPFGFIDSWTRLDAHTSETCGLPFFTALMGTMEACLEVPAGVESPFDTGPCLDPREHPEALLSTDEVLDLLEIIRSGSGSEFI